MIKGTCKNCEHWEKLKYDDSGFCNSDKESGDKENEVDGFRGLSSGGCYHVITTGPDFGCIHFYKRSSKNA